jgi:hypothetical protein
MLEAVGYEFFGEMRQRTRNVCEVGDPDGKHNPPSSNHFAILESEEKSVRGRIETDNQLIFELRDHAVPKGQAISREGL